MTGVTRLLHGKGISTRDVMVILKNKYGFEIRQDTLYSLLSKDYIGKSKSWDIVRECLDKDFDIVYISGFGWQRRNNNE